MGGVSVDLDNQEKNILLEGLYALRCRNCPARHICENKELGEKSPCAKLKIRLVNEGE
jgi:hypothetical protein